LHRLLLVNSEEYCCQQSARLSSCSWRFQEEQYHLAQLSSSRAPFQCCFSCADST